MNPELLHLDPEVLHLPPELQHLNQRGFLVNFTKMTPPLFVLERVWMCKIVWGCQLL